MNSQFDNSDSQVKRRDIKVVDDKWLRIGDQSYPIKSSWEIQFREGARPEFFLYLLGLCVASPLIGVSAGHAVRVVIAIFWGYEKGEGDWAGRTWLGWTLNILSIILAAVVAILIVGVYFHNKTTYDKLGPKYCVYALLKSGKREVLILENGTKQMAEDVRKEFEVLVGNYMR